MKSIEKRQARIHPLSLSVIVLLSLIFLGSLSFFAFTYYYSDKIFPNVYVAGVNIGGKTEEEAKAILLQKTAFPEKITLESKDKPFELSLKEIELTYDLDSTINEAYMQYRKSDIVSDSLLQLGTFTQSTSIPLATDINEEKLDEYLQVIAGSLETAAKFPGVTLTNGSVKVDPGKEGEIVDTATIKKTIVKNVESVNFSPIDVSYQTVDPALTEGESKAFKEKAEKLVGKSVTLEHEFTTFKIKDTKLLSLLNPRDTIYESKAKELISKEVSPIFNRPPQNAVFKFTEGKVEEFKPAKNGVTINEDELIKTLTQKIEELENTDGKDLALGVPVQTAPASVTTKEVNDLGINELIGRGTSKFTGSIASRVFNVGHASGKLNGVLIPPDTVFSFDDTVGDVSQLTGYKQAYIIQNGRTILGDGGGLCQVSTTLFRAALNAGLPIMERRAHAYRVGYYEQDSGPGLDATVYVPTTDFKFKNDTPNTILIQTIFDAKAMTLAFELYGTKDGRVATITKPVITRQIAPPEDKYIDDPTLAAGKVNQVEHKAWGATVKFDYKVERNGETIYEKIFTSNYQPWGNVFMKGVGPGV